MSIKRKKNLNRSKKRPSRKFLSALVDAAYNSTLDARLRNELNKRNEEAHHVQQLEHRRR